MIIREDVTGSTFDEVEPQWKKEDIAKAIEKIKEKLK